MLIILENQFFLETYTTVELRNGSELLDHSWEEQGSEKGVDLF